MFLYFSFWCPFRLFYKDANKNTTIWAKRFLFFVFPVLELVPFQVVLQERQQENHNLGKRTILSPSGHGKTRLVLLLFVGKMGHGNTRLVLLLFVGKMSGSQIARRSSNPAKVKNVMAQKDKTQISLLNTQIIGSQCAPASFPHPMLNPNESRIKPQVLDILGHCRM